MNGNVLEKLSLNGASKYAISKRFSYGVEYMQIRLSSPKKQRQADMFSLILAKHGTTFENWLFHQIEFYLYVNKKTVNRNERFLAGLITYKQLKVLCEAESLFVPSRNLMRYYRNNNWKSGKDYIELKKSARSNYLYHESRVMKFLRNQQIKRSKRKESSQIENADFNNSCFAWCLN